MIKKTSGNSTTYPQTYKNKTVMTKTDDREFYSSLFDRKRNKHKQK